MLSAIQQGWQRPRWCNRLLYPLSMVYVGVMRLRSQAYRWGILTRHKLPKPLVVIGNLSVGGVGKTPLLMELVEQLKTRGMYPGVISRGYRGNSDFWPREVNEQVTAAEVGDEAMLIFKRCQVPVVVGPKRVQSAHLLIHTHRCDIVLSDDGFQHLALQRDLDIVVIDGQRRFGNGWCLPAGPLREPRSALARADLIVANQPCRTPITSGEFVMHTYIDQAIHIGNKQTRKPPQKLSEFAGQTVHAVAGIGNPSRFFKQLQAYGIKVVPHEYPDHHTFTAADFAFTATQRTNTVLMTEKDAVKCDPLITSGTIAANHSGAVATTSCQYWKVPLRVHLAPGLVDAVCEYI